MATMVGQIVRKQLWGRSGSRCAICNTELTQVDGTDSIVGDEAHIRSPKDGGPRFDPDCPPEKLDSYENLFLLCKNHHKLVDDNPDVFPVELLEQIKRNHEARVAKALDKPNERAGWVQPPVLRSLNNGTEVMDIVLSGDAIEFDNEHPETKEEAALIGDFLQNARDWAEVGDMIGQSDRVSAAMDFHDQLTQLQSAGCLVLGGAGRWRHPSGLVFGCSVLRVVRHAADRPND